MAVKVNPKYSSEVGRLELDLKDDMLIMKLFDKNSDEICGMDFDRDYFKRHFKIVSKFGNSVDIKPKFYSEVDDVLRIYYGETNDTLNCSYDRFDFELDNEKTKELINELLD